MIEQLCIEETLLDSAKEVFETMIFLSVEQTVEQESIAENVSLLCSITFNGNIEGCLTINCSSDCARTIAMNMLGMTEDEEISDAEIQDAIGEVTNMVMGSIKSRIQDTVGDFQVSIPTLVSGKNMVSYLGETPSQKSTAMISIEGDYTAELSLLYRENFE